MTPNPKRLEDEVDDFSNTDGTIRDTSEIEGAANVLNDDSINPDTKLSKIDLNTRLLESQVGMMTNLSELGKLGVIPNVEGFCLNIKRLNVSIGGEGRKELVAVSQGIMQQQQGMGMGEKFMNLFKPKQPNQ